MAVTQVAFRTNKRGEWTFQTNATSTFTDAFLLKKGKTAYWSFGTGLVGTGQIQAAVPGTSTFVPTPFNQNIDITVTTVGVAGSFTAPADTLFRVALTAWTSGSCTVQIRI